MYEWLIPEHLHFDGFKLLTLDKIDGCGINTIRRDNLEGCILEIKVEHPKELHALHNDYPLAPGKIEIKEGMLSYYCKNLQISIMFQLVESKSLCLF